MLFPGVIYHLEDPIRALHRISEVCKDRLVLESLVVRFDRVEFGECLSNNEEMLDRSDMKYMLLSNTDHCRWLPTESILREMLRRTGFEVDSAEEGSGPARIIMKARKRR